MRGGLAILTTTLAAVFAAAAPAAARINVFDGWCSFSGTTTYDEPLTRQVGDNVSRSMATGVCYGRVNGVDYYEGVPAESVTEMPFRGSCYEQTALGKGRGDLRLRVNTPSGEEQVVITYSMTFTSDPVSGTTYRFFGDHSGSGYGTVEYTNPSTTGAVVACETDGLRESQFTANSSTEQPLSSRAPEAPAGLPAADQREGALAGAAVEMLSSRLGQALRRGVLVRCRVVGRASCRIALAVAPATARRYRLGSRRLAVRTITVPEGKSSAVALLRVRGTARSRLAGARSLRIRVVARLEGDGAVRTLRTSRRLRWGGLRR